MRRIAPECARIAPEEELRSAPFVAEEFERCLLLGSESQHERQHGGHRPTRTTAVRGVADAEEEAKLAPAGEVDASPAQSLRCLRGAPSVGGAKLRASRSSTRKANLARRIARCHPP